MQKLVWQNANGLEIDLTSGNYGITEWQGFSNTSLNIQQQQVPFQDGGVFLDALMEQRELTVTLAIQDNNNLEIRYEKRRELISALNPKLGEGYLIYTNDFISKRIKCIPQIPLFENHNSNDSGTPKASLSWTACEPYWEDLNVTVVPLVENKSVIVQNNGETDVGIEARLYIQSATKPVIKNITENKEIKIQGSYTQDIKINTKTGEKNIRLLENEDFKLLSTYTHPLCITYSKKLEQFCVGSGQIIVTSKDGRNWDISTNGIEEGAQSYSFNDVVYSESLEIYCIVAYMDTAYSARGYIFTSTDGKNWTLRLESSNGLYGITYSEEKQLFCAVGENGVIYTSSDGISWTERTSGISTNLFSVCYSANLDKFCAGTTSKVILSSDGITWGTQATSALQGDITSITYSEDLNLFVATGYSVYTSIYGLSWTARITGSDTPTTVKYIEELKMFYAVGFDVIAKSDNGIDWQEEYITDLSDKQGIAYSPKLGRICIVTDVIDGRNMGFGFLLSNGNGWEKGNIKQFDGNIIYSKAIGKYLCINASVYSSTDGLNWEYEQFVNQTGISSIAYAEDKNLYIGIGYKKIYKSTDGLNWVVVTSETAQNLEDIAYSPKLGLFCITGYRGLILTSEDGDNWTTISTNITQTITSICWSVKQKKFVAVTFSDSNTRYLISTDGINWEIGIIGNIGFNDIIYSEELNIYMAVGNGIYNSYDGKVWNAVRAEITPIMRKIIYSKTKGSFYIGGDSGVLYKCNDGYNLTIVDTGTYAWITQINVLDDLDLLYIYADSLLCQQSTEGNDIISSLSEGSDMSLNLKVGNNDILLTCETGNVGGYLSFRQKYIGV